QPLAMRGRACWRHGLLPPPDFKLDKFQSYFRSLQYCSRNDRDAPARLRACAPPRLRACAPPRFAMRERSMRYRMITVLVAAILPFAVGAQETQPAKDAAKEGTKDLPKAYLPGLEQFMNMILIEHNKLWFAGQARNWPLAAYELGEIKEIMSDVQD